MLLAATGIWFGWAAWRAHRQLVTLGVRNAPLAEVLRKIERQTWKKIRAEKSVANARVTLHVTDKPLDDVLDRLAEQARARWSTLHAVYGSSRALKALDSALRGDGQIEPAGWTKIAPSPPDFDKPGTNEAGPGFAPGKRGVGGMMGRRNGPICFEGSPNGQMEMWSPEALVMESSLRPRLGNDRAIQQITPTAAAAAQTARKVNGRWVTFLAFRKSSMGVGSGMRTLAPPGFSAQGPIPPGGHTVGPGPNSNSRFTRLTPEQRVQRERDRLGVNAK